MRGVEGESQGQPERERSQRTERPLPASTRSAGESVFCSECAVDSAGIWACQEVKCGSNYKGHGCVTQ